MEKYEKLPTEENLIQTLKMDSIGRNRDIIGFYNIIEAQKFASTIAVDGRWGSGKTFFVRQTQMLINAFNGSYEMAEESRNKLKSILPSNTENENSSIAIYYDAWKNDNDMEPVLSLIYEISRQVGETLTVDNSSIRQKAVAIFDALSGHNISEMIKNLSPDDLFCKLKEKKSVEKKIKEFLSELPEERANRLVIFIDELDRCKPTFAIRLLEQIKHYVSDDRITFVFSVNLEQLQHTIKSYYGENFDSCRYLDRFFDIRIDLPQADMKKFYDSIDWGAKYMIDSVIKRVIKMYNLQLREITRFYSQVKVAVDGFNSDDNMYNSVFSNEYSNSVIITYIVPLLIGLGIADISKRDRFLEGLDAQPLIDLIDIDEDSYLLQRLLNDNESLEKYGNENFITPDELIERLYRAIFVNQHKNKYGVRVGRCDLKKNSKAFAIRVSAMLSNYAGL